MRDFEAQAEIDRLRAENEALRALNRSIEVENDDAKDCVSMLIICGEQGGKKKDEKTAEYLRRLIDALVKTKAECKALRRAAQALAGFVNYVQGQAGYDVRYQEVYLAAHNALAEVALAELALRTAPEQTNCDSALTHKVSP